MSGGLIAAGACGNGLMPSATRSAPVSTASTPGTASAGPLSIARMYACACGERTITAYACPGRLTSSLKLPAPVSRRRSSTRGSGCPMPPGVRDGVTSPPPSFDRRDQPVIDQLGDLEAVPLDHDHVAVAVDT